MSWRSGFAVGIWLARLLAAGCLLGLGGYRWVLGSYWHNVGMLDFRNALATRLADNSLGYLTSYGAIAKAYAYAPSSLLAARASVVARPANEWQQAQVWADIGLPQGTCFNYSKQDPKYRLFLEPVLRDAPRGFFSFGDIQANWHASVTEGDFLDLRYEVQDGVCTARLKFSVADLPGHQVTFVQSAPVLPSVAYRVDVKFHYAGQALVSFGPVLQWYAPNVHALVKSSDDWQQISFSYIPKVGQVQERFRFIIKSGSGELVLHSVMVTATFEK